MRLTAQPGRIEVPHVAEGLIVEAHALIGGEDGDRRRDAVERARLAGHLAGQLVLHILQRRDVDHRAGAGAADRHDDGVEAAPFAGHHGLQPLAERFAAGERGFRRAALARLQKLALLVEHLIGAGGLDGRDIGAVDPDQLALRVAEPDGHGQRVEQRLLRGEFLIGGALLAQQVGEFDPAPGEIAEFEIIAAARSARLGFDMRARPASSPSARRGGRWLSAP